MYSRSNREFKVDNEKIDRIPAINIYVLYRLQQDMRLG